MSPPIHTIPVNDLIEHDTFGLTAIARAAPHERALEARPERARILGNPEADDAAVAAVLGAVAQSGALERARRDALRYIEDARSVLDSCPDTVERELLAQVAAQVVDRYS